MLDIKFILNNSEKVKEKLKTRNFDISIIDKVCDLGKIRSQKMTKLQTLEQERNQKSALIGKMVREKQDPTLLKKELETLKNNIETLNIEVENIKKELEEKLLFIPNLPLDNVPIGKSEEDNIVIKTYDKLGRGLVASLKPHYEIGVDLDILDFTRAVKMSGSRFAIFKKDGAKLVRALVNFMIDTHINNGYTEMLPPTMVSTKMMYGTGQLPKFREDQYKIENEDLWMIPTAEVPLTNYYNDEIIDLEKPKMFVGYTKCYRAEAGSGGRDTKGLIRSHEFHKVELVKIVSQEQAMTEFEKTVKDAESILTKLEIPYRSLSLCTGDIGFSSQKTIDLELWLPSEKRFREVSSISIFGDFQARRSMIRYKNNEGKTVYANTINGSGIAIDRVFAAILEQYQNEDGSIDIPQALIPYMNGQTKIK